MGCFGYSNFWSKSFMERSLSSEDNRGQNKEFFVRSLHKGHVVEEYVEELQK